MIRIMSCGGGTAGHITPVIAVAEAIIAQSPDVELSYVGPKGDINARVISDSALPFKMFAIYAGKFRRYHNRGVIAHVLDVHTNWLNFKDIFKIMIGFLQSLALLIRYRPQVIFAKGGYVVVPLCTAARLLGIKYITHDSDAVAGLANRLIARGAELNAVANEQVTVYPKTKTLVSGIPLQKEYYDRVGASQAVYRQKVGLKPELPMLLIYTGTQGALTIDNAAEPIVNSLLADYPELQIVHVFGRMNEHTMKNRYHSLPQKVAGRLHRKVFLDNAYDWIAAADVIIARAGATSIAEFAAIGRAVIIVPADALTGGQQVRNAQHLSEHKRAVVVRESELSQRLESVVRELLDHPDRRDKLARALHAEVPSDASKVLAQTLISIASREST